MLLVREIFRRTGYFYLNALLLGERPYHEAEEGWHWLGRTHCRQGATILKGAALPSPPPPVWRRHLEPALDYAAATACTFTSVRHLYDHPIHTTITLVTSIRVSAFKVCTAKQAVGNLCGFWKFLKRRKLDLINIFCEINWPTKLCLSDYNEMKRWKYVL